ncbi:MAG TPA: type I restriction endonuclease subunit R [Bacteroidetes bacterium]|nr:type I restriction endonuclease subunit R [Bacteroidota bacterium]
MSSYSEYPDSQLPAMNLLRKMGYHYLPRQLADKYRKGIASNVLLEDILEERLHAINGFEYKGRGYRFSSGNIAAAIQTLKNIPDEGLVSTNEKIYDLLTLGKSFEEKMGSDRKSFTIRYIDWENIENNHFHIVDEYTVSGPKEKRRPDIVLFVNGIPFVVIENKRRDKPRSVTESISQHIRNQKAEMGIPKLFHYAQLLMAVEPNKVKYATVGTRAKFWSIWKEEKSNEAEVKRLLELPGKGAPATDRLPTEQDRTIYSLCKKERLLELANRFIVFDAPEKKIARYQQYFAVKATMRRILDMQDEGVQRKGGVIWHTQGSGKSLTMVMLSKSIRLSPKIKNPRVLVVTDRISLDTQIHKTFHQCGVSSLKKAKSGNDLARLISKTNTEVITTITDKFDTALKKQTFSNSSPNIFVLVDESHRSQYGRTHAKMRRVLPNACYIGFTGTPLMKKEKSTSRKFGGYIHIYSIDKAVKDGAVLPLLYEGRSAKLSINKQPLDRGFDRVMEPLNDEETRDFKKKFARISKLYESQQVVEEIAFDISEHYCKNWQGSGFKAQLAVPKIDTAIKFQQYFENQVNPKLRINSAVVFTPPDSRGGHDDVWSETKEESKKYWKSLMEKHGSQVVYEKNIIEHFKDKGNEVELLIVVSKLLTGFDAPRNTILYLAKPLSDHTLLQAIARVNRLFEGKEHGYIIDYVGILGKLDKALNDYSALEEFDKDDILGAMTNVLEEVRKVPVVYSAVWEVFKEVKNKKDKEALERHLGAKNIRDIFYGRLSIFARTLQMALSTDEFYKEYTDARIDKWLKELKFFHNMRLSVQKRYAEVVDYREYEGRVKKLLDTYVSVEEIKSINKPINIFDKHGRKEEMEKQGKSAASVADTIAHEMKRTCTEKMDEDPVFYLKFSELMEAVIKKFNEERISETEYLEEVMQIRDEFTSGGQSGLPDLLKDRQKARPIYRAIIKMLGERYVKIKFDENRIAKAAIDLDMIIQNIATVDWKMNSNKPNEISNAVEDYFLEKRKEIGVELSFGEIDKIITQVLKISKNNY